MNRNNNNNNNNGGSFPKKRPNKNKNKNKNKRAGMPLPVIIAPTHRCILKYTSHISGFSDVTQYGSLDYLANGVFDPSVSGSDSSKPDGFTSLATLYNNYIVNSCTLDLLVSNREDFAVNIATGFFPGGKTIGSAAEAIDVGEGPFGDARIISAKGGMDRTRIIRKVRLEDLWNNRYYYGDSAFQATTATNPSALGHIIIAAAGPGSTTLANGLSVNVRLIYDVTFSGRKGTDEVSLTAGTTVVDLFSVNPLEEEST